MVKVLGPLWLMNMISQEHFFGEFLHKYWLGLKDQLNRCWLLEVKGQVLTYWENVFSSELKNSCPNYVSHKQSFRFLLWGWNCVENLHQHHRLYSASSFLIFLILLSLYWAEKKIYESGSISKRLTHNIKTTDKTEGVSSRALELVGTLGPGLHDDHLWPIKPSQTSALCTQIVQYHHRKAPSLRCLCLFTLEIRNAVITPHCCVIPDNKQAFCNQTRHDK